MPSFLDGSESFLEMRVREATDIEWVEAIRNAVPAGSLVARTAEMRLKVLVLEKLVTNARLLSKRQHLPIHSAIQKACLEAGRVDLFWEVTSLFFKSGRVAEFFSVPTAVATPSVLFSKPAE